MALTQCFWLLLYLGDLPLIYFMFGKRTYKKGNMEMGKVALSAGCDPCLPRPSRNLSKGRSYAKSIHLEDSFLLN